MLTVAAVVTMAEDLVFSSIIVCQQRREWPKKDGDVLSGCACCTRGLPPRRSRTPAPMRTNQRWRGSSTAATLVVGIDAGRDLLPR